MDNNTMDSLIRGLMILGRTKEEAIKEISANESDRYREMEKDFYEYDPRTGKSW